MGFCDQHEEECHAPCQVNGVSGICVEFEEDEHFPTEHEAQIPTEYSKQVQSPTDGNSETAGTNDSGSKSATNFRCLERQALRKGLSYKARLGTTHSMNVDFI